MRQNATGIRLLPHLLFTAIGLSALAGDWPHFLGPHGDTSVREEGIRTEFPDSGLPLLWKRAVGGGYSGPAVVEDRVFVMDRIAEPYDPGKTEGNPNFIRAEIPGKERVRALNAKTGKVIWEHAYDCPYSTVYLYAIGPRCTPTVDGERIYTLGAEGDLLCFQAASGVVLWQKSFKDAYGLEVPEWGCAAHPLVYKDLLVCIVGGNGSTVVAFDKHTGEERWRALSASRPGYCPPVIATIHGLEQLLIWHGDGVAALEPSTGKQHWFAKVKPLYGMSIGAPRVHNDLIHVMGYKGVSAAIRVAPDNRSAEVLWGPDLRIGVAGILNTAHLDEGGYLYSAGGRGRFQCVDIRTGERLWESPVPLQNASGERTGAWPSAFSFHHPPSGRTFLYNDHGELITCELSTQSYREISRTKLIEPTHRVGGRDLVWSAPAFANQRIYVRNDQEIRCYDLLRTHARVPHDAALMHVQQAFIDEGHALSTVFRLARGGETLYEHAVASDQEGDRSIRDDTLFAIWSMTKPITSVAAMILHERGAFQLDDPVSEVLPRLGTYRVESDADDEKTEPLARQITYRHLLTHTSGIAGYDGSFDQEGTWKEVMELDDLVGLIELLASKPLKHQPGERYTYGLSTAVLGAAIEKLTKKPFNEFLREAIFAPLGMNDTRFHLTKDDRPRFQPLFVKTDDGFRPGTPAEDELYYKPDSRLHLGGEGLVSTLADYGRFCQMLVDCGRTPDGQSVISEQTLSVMLEDQLGETPGFSESENGYALGFGFHIFKDAERDATGMPEGCYGWGGYHSTCFWIDPANSQYGLFMSRRYPFFGAATPRLQAAVYRESHRVR
jgi:CubicO group peptidase (beta-lactamase class C family)/outer membrane protein assembly factor BamB